MKKQKEKKLNKIYNEIISLRLKHEREFIESDFNSFIAVGFLPGASINKMIGRIVQVRLESGCFGSNQIFIRDYDGIVHCHENQWFHKIPMNYSAELNEIFKDSFLDEKGIIYSIGGKMKRKGFIVKSPIKKGQTTPMREIRKSINNKLSEILS